MRFQNVKSAKEISIPGVSIELDEATNGLRTVTFSHDGAPVCRCVMDSYSMQLQRIADPKYKEVYRLSGTVIGLPVLQDFESEYKATDEKNRLLRSVGNESDAVLTIEKTKVEE